MAVASGHWVEKEIQGEPPSPRQGHALAVAGDVAFVFGGVMAVNQQGDYQVYFNDFYMLTVSPEQVTWEQIPQNGDVPSARAGHTLCVVRGNLYLFGGAAQPDAPCCLPGVYCFDIVSLTWNRLATGGMALRTLRHSSVAVGDNIYVYGGIVDGEPTDDLMVFNTVSLMWTPVRTTGALPSPRYSQLWAPVGEQVFMFGGRGEQGEVYKDLHVLHTDSLVWQKLDVKGDSPQTCSGATLTAHHDKDIYLFGGRIINVDGNDILVNEIHKLSIAKVKWKVPLYVGIPPVRRHGHTAFILHSHLYVFGGRGDDEYFNDLRVMKIINPSERQPVMKEILSEFGLQGISHGFIPTKVPNVKYELSESPQAANGNAAVHTQRASYRDFGAVRDQALKMIQGAFSLLDQEMNKLDRERAELSQEAVLLQADRQAYEALRRKHEQELKDMIDRHRSQNEAWLRARAEENDRERRELSRMREEVVAEQINVQKRSEHLLSVMNQFKGM